MKSFFSVCILLLLLTSCNNGSLEHLADGSCVRCHDMELDPSHRIGCLSCHDGDDTREEKDLAHVGMTKNPAHPDNMEQRCGGCHSQQVQSLRKSRHFTLDNLVNTFRQPFGATVPLKSFLETPTSNTPKTKLALADDLLRSRCLRCHLYTKGDDYPAVERGTGCAACHLQFNGGKLVSHRFLPPTDNQCLSCHYGNRVGFDYYGRFEHDLHDEYKIPFTKKPTPSSYGINYHHLQPDIHQQAGMVCRDCHSGDQLMSRSSPGPKCRNCHSGDSLKRTQPPGVETAADQYRFVSVTGQTHRLPLANPEFHTDAERHFTCQVCHAQWSFVDTPKHFLRDDTDDYSPWSALTGQGDSAVENLLRHNLDFDLEELPPEIRDKINGETRTGIWHRGYERRRWEELVLAKGEDGRYGVVRPLLDYRLSWRDANETVRFDNISPDTKSGIFRRYAPHTIGPAGIFWENRLLEAIERTDGPK